MRIRALVFCATMTPIGFSDREVNGLALLTIEIQSLLAGGTRLNIGRPQVRWTDGVECAKCVCDTRSVSTKGSNALSISIRIRDAIKELTNLRITASSLSQ